MNSPTLGLRLQGHLWRTLVSDGPHACSLWNAKVFPPPTHAGACMKVPSLQKCWLHGCFLVECISGRWVGATFHGDIFTELTPAPRVPEVICLL